MKTETLIKLICWYNKNQRALPWRQNPNPYWVWLAEIMSQQTQMSALLPYFYRFIKHFPTVEILAKSELDEVLKFWTGLGYYSRARNVHKAAQKIYFELNGNFPRTYSGWLELPGIGPYTAAAISSQCNEWPAAVWDGNVHRVSARYFAEKNSRTEKFKEQIKQGLEEQMNWYPKKIIPSKINQALMELGALVCTVKNPKCERCPIQSTCCAFLKNKVSDYPVAKDKKEFILLSPKYFIVMRKTKNVHEVLLVKRSRDQWFSGMWDFPSELGGVKTPVLEIQKERVKANLKLKPIGTVKHSITHHKINLEAYLANGKLPVFKDYCKNFAEQKWVTIDDLYSEQPPIPLATTTRKLMRCLAREIEIK